MAFQYFFPGNSEESTTGQSNLLGGNAMPKLKSVLAGLAISTALAGGAVVTGAATSAVSANAATQISTGTSIVAGNSCYRWNRCGWRRNHHPKLRLRIKIHNYNYNRNHHRDRHETTS